MKDIAVVTIGADELPEIITTIIDLKLTPNCRIFITGSKYH